MPSDAPQDIQFVEDLAIPEVAAEFRKLIQGINPGAGVSRVSRQMVDDYGLAAQGFPFENGSLDGCTGAHLDAIAAGGSAVVPLRRPQWLQFLRNVAPGNDVISESDHAMRREGIAPRNAARARIDAESKLIRSWIKQQRETPTSDRRLKAKSA